MKALAILLVAAAPAAVLLYGMHLGRTDAENLYADEARADKIAAIQCGRHALVAKRRDGARFCVFANPDGQAIARPVFDNPIGAM
ncbi:hypothetical protein WKR98_13430 [Pigmentiphaga sp. YJ18]|uniref:hypothetical protein n=1 Tax=Pigmentiphaga sp. YJ18 TaxID=3134907 RepID=UPI003114EAD0